MPILQTTILAVHLRSCCKHWKIARGRPSSYIIGKMVELICLVDIETTPRHSHVFRSGLSSITSECISSQRCFM